MAKISKYVSDISKKDIDEPIKITIERPGYMIQFGALMTTNRLELDIDVDDLKYVHKHVTFVPAMIPKHSPDFQIEVSKDAI